MTREYLKQAESDANDMLGEFLDQMIEQWEDNQQISDDLFNDYSGGDSYHHESHVDKSYNLTEAAAILDELSEWEETDHGLWDGQEPRQAIATQAAYTYGNAVYSAWRDKIEELNDVLNAVEFKNEEEQKWFGKLYLTAYVRLNNYFQPVDCKGMVGNCFIELDQGDTTALAVLLDYIEEHEPSHKQSIVKELRKILAERPAVFKYQRIVFCQGEDANEPLRILDEQGEEAAIEYLAQWDMDPPGELFDESSAGSDDDVFESDDGYILSYNTRLGYIGLERKLT